VADALFDVLFGWIVELLPWDISAARRERVYSKGGRVHLRVLLTRNEAPATLAFVVAQQGKLWTAKARNTPEGALAPLPLPRSRNEIVISDRATWTKDRYIEYPHEQGVIRISSKGDWPLLRRALDDAITASR
jgi:hypothetical protein